MRRTPGCMFLWVMAAVAFVAGTAAAQPDASMRGSRNVTVLGHLDVPGSGALVIDQEPGRPYAYLARRSAPGGFVVIGLGEPSAPKILFATEAGMPATHDVAYFKHQGRFYVILAVQQAAALVFDVTGLPDAATVREVARVEADGGFREVFAYKHSDGRALLFATGGGPAYVYDLARLLAGDDALLAQIDTPEQVQTGASGFEDLFVGFEPEAGQDRLYAAGAGGYYLFDVTDPAGAALLTAVSSAAVQRGYRLAPTPDGRHLVAAASYSAAPLRIFDLQPAFDGTVPRVRTAVGAWAADWRHGYADLAMRWPYVFVAALNDGLQVFNLRAPAEPYTVAFYRTSEVASGAPATPAEATHGAYDVDVRNADGLIGVSDLETGFWVFSLEAFEGWHGHGWGLPHMSNAQDWDAGPDR